VVEWNNVMISGVIGTNMTSRSSCSKAATTSFSIQDPDRLGSDGSSATIGVEYGDGVYGREFSYNRTGAVIQGQAILFVPYPTGGTPPSNACSVYTVQWMEVVVSSMLRHSVSRFRKAR